MDESKSLFGGRYRPAKIGQYLCFRATIKRADTRWTWHLLMSFLTTTPAGHFNAFGRRYWPLSDRVKTTWRLRSSSRCSYFRPAIGISRIRMSDGDMFFISFVELFGRRWIVRRLEDGDSNREPRDLPWWHPVVAGTEAYWLDTIAQQARKAVDAWSEFGDVDADTLCLQKHLRALDRTRRG